VEYSLEAAPLDMMDKGGDMGGPSANSSSDFVSLYQDHHYPSSSTDCCAGSQVIQVSSQCLISDGVVRDQRLTRGAIECSKILRTSLLYVGEKVVRVLWYLRYVIDVCIASSLEFDVCYRMKNSQN
jgi:hypothetical protein